MYIFLREMSNGDFAIARVVRKKPREVLPAGGGGRGLPRGPWLAPLWAGRGAPRGVCCLGRFREHRPASPGQFHFWVCALAQKLPGTALVCREALLHVVGPEPGVTVTVSCAPHPVPFLAGWAGAWGWLTPGAEDVGPFGRCWSQHPPGLPMIPDQFGEARGLWEGSALASPSGSPVTLWSAPDSDGH